jgi:hypothetical protein
MGSQRENSTPTDRDIRSEDEIRTDRGVQTDRVHVRKLDAVDTLRWSWAMLTDRLELVGLTFAVGLLSVVALLGISRPVPSEPPRIADWVWPMYLAFFLAVALVWGVVYLTANRAVEGRPAPLGDRLVSAATRLPALLVTAVLMWLVSAIGLLLFVLPGVYLFHRLVLAYPACVIDGKGPLGSLKAGWRASRGSVLKVFAVNVVYFALVAGSNVVANAFGEYTLAGGFVSAGLSAVVIPLFGLAFGHLYLESSRNQ